AIGKIVAHPTDPNILFAVTASALAGIGGTIAGLAVPSAGLYRTTNALSANPVFERLIVSPLNGGSRRMIDAVIEPGNANHLLVTLVDSEALGDGGVYLSTNALDPVPTFTRTLVTGTSSETGRAELAIQKTGSTVTVYAATGVGSGTIYKSVDGGLTFPQSLDNNFCSGQCFYDIAVAVDPTDANKVYLGGSPTLVFGRSVDGGLSFTTNAQTATGLHVDTHAIAVAPSNPNMIYFGSDGGIWTSLDTGTNWTSRNNTMFSATQFEGIALHPTDRNFTIGGTQDNGTQWLKPNGTWVRTTGGDGGQSIIDQNATDTTNVTAYHTFFNQTNTQIGYQRISTFNAAGTTQPGTFRGCTSGNPTGTGINCSDAVLFYAPITRGPGNPNSTYIGTTKLYRSGDRGDTHTVVSQQFGARISAIGISPSNDNIRIVGLTNGQVFSSIDGSTTLDNITGSIPARYVARFAIDPTNANIAYVSLNGFGLANGQHVWKTTNLLSGAAATWSVSGNGIPDVPVNAFVIDPANTNTLYAGTDIGVYRSLNGGATWLPFNDGLPRVAVFDMAIQPLHRILRIATHGKGIWEMNLASTVTRRVPADFDGDGKTDISVFRPSGGNWFIQNSSNNAFRAELFGTNGDVIVPGDYDGDGRTDISVFRAGNWYIQQSANNQFRAVQFGISTDKPVQADYDGDGKDDIAVFRDGNWYIQQSSNNQFRAVQWGAATDLPVTGDYDADGKADMAVFRPSNGTWYVLKSSDNTLLAGAFGQSGDKPVAGDYDNDGRTDFAVFRPSNGTWYVQQTTAGFRAIQWGSSSDIPAQGDYDGDGRTDFAVYRSSEGNWYISLNANGQFRSANFGTNGDIPVPSAYNPLP
ncbi:MAG TPA: VCBS repeat-containing protein, partial [Pyrinomonadaceae bacterium]|nr:VCBS repeat-containing protein [Pyrinomonadaceae bacterium]